MGSFFRRRFGQHAVDYLVDPVMSGIYAGDINKLSVCAFLGRSFCCALKRAGVDLHACVCGYEGDC